MDLEERYDLLKEKIHFTGNQLKLIALICMAIDHVGYCMFPTYLYPNAIWLRVIGRVAFPIFAFLIAEGAFYTKHPIRYMLRMLLLAIVSEIPFDLVNYPYGWRDMLVPKEWSIGPVTIHAITGPFTDKFMQHQNVFFTLLLGLICCIVAYRCKYLIVVIVTFFGCAYAASTLNTDYAAFGVTLIFVCAMTRRMRPMTEMAMGLLIFTYDALLLRNEIVEETVKTFSYARFAQLIAVVLILFYTGERGKKLEFGKFAYWFYPVHLSAIFAIFALTHTMF